MGSNPSSSAEIENRISGRCSPVVWLGRRLRSGAWAKNALADLRAAEGVEYRFDSAGISFHAPGRNLQQTWSSLHRCLETPIAFAIYTSPAAALIVPKRAFAAAEQARLRTRLLELIDHCGALPFGERSRACCCSRSYSWSASSRFGTCWSRISSATAIRGVRQLPVVAKRTLAHAVAGRHDDSGNKLSPCSVKLACLEFRDSAVGGC